MKTPRLKILPDAKAADGVHRYAKDVLAGKIVAGPSIRAVCQRHLDDLKKSKRKDYPYKFDAEKAGRMMNFFPIMMSLRSGQFEGKPFVLLPWQRFMVGSIGGWVKKETGFRRFKSVYMQSGKGSGKSPLVAGIGLYLLVADGEASAEIYLAAADYNQAGIVMADILSAVELNPVLDDNVIVRGGKARPSEITYESPGKGMSILRRIAHNSTGGNISGFRPSAGIFDEIAFWPSAEMLDILRRGVKSRQQPLMLFATNAGAGIESPAWPLYQHAVAVANGEVEDETHLPLVFDLDREDDVWNDESCWVKSNPSYPTLPSPDYLRGEVARSKSIPGERNAVRRQHFNEWISDSSQYFLGEEDIDAVVVDKLNDEILKPLPMVVGLDLSKRDDLTAVACVWKDEEKIYVRTHFWLPGDDIDARSMSVPPIPWNVWAERGVVETVEGKLIDYTQVAERLMQWKAIWNFRGIAYDAWGSDYLFGHFKTAGIGLYMADVEGLHREPPAGKMVLWKHPQGYIKSNPSKKRGADLYDNGLKTPLWMNSSIADFRDAVLEKKIVIEKNPCMRYNLVSVRTMENDSGGVRFTKSKSTGKIDGVVAATMGVGLINSLPERSTSPRAMLVG